jgi:hypothetical protein
MESGCYLLPADATSFDQLERYELRYHLDVMMRGKKEERDLTLTVKLSDLGTTVVEMLAGAS